MVLNCWKRLFAFVAFVATLGVCWNTSTITFVPQAFAADQAPVLVLSPENAKAVGDTVRMQDLANKLAECKASEAGLTKDCKQLNEAYVQALGLCRPGCDPKYFLEHRECPPTASVGTSPVAKALNAGKAVPVAVWCTDARLANGDVVTAKTFGKKAGACVPSIQLFDRFVSETHQTFSYVCEPADGVDVSAEELAKAGITERLSADDPRCKKTGIYVQYLLFLHQQFAAKQLTPENWALVWLDYLNRHNGEQKLANGDDSLAEIKAQLADHERRIGVLEQKGTHVQLLAEGLANLRFAKDAPNTFGAMFRANLIQMMSEKNGVMFGLGFGYGKQPHSEEALWKASVEWYHLLNKTTKDASTLYGMHLGGCLEGGWLLQNVQDEMEGGACGGFQIIPGGTFTIDISALIGYGRYGLYDENTRNGYSALHPVLGLSLGLGANIF